MTYFARRLVDGCWRWVQVHTDIETWRRLPHVGRIVAGCVVASGAGVGIHEIPKLIPPAIVERGSVSPLPAFVRPASVPVPAPEPSGALVLAVAVAGVAAARWAKGRPL